MEPGHTLKPQGVRNDSEVSPARHVVPALLRFADQAESSASRSNACQRGCCKE